MRLASPLVLASALMLSFPPAAVAQLRVNCRPGPENCNVVITMSAGCGSGIKVAPDPIVVAARTKVQIVWTIQANEWQFAPDGIVIHQMSPAFGKGPAGAGKTFKATNENTQPGTFKYDINLKDELGRPCKLDPIIINH